MKKLYINCLLFCVPIFLLLYLLPINNRLKYQELKNDCFNHCLWIYDRIFTNEKPVDIAFIGSSHTINGVNDRLITSSSNNIQAANFGYCRLGMDLNYALAKEVIENKKPKHIIIEVRESEDRYSHPVFPHIAQSKAVVFPSLFFNKLLVSNVWTHFSYKLEIFQEGVYNYDSIAPIRKSDYGFVTSADTVSIDILNQIRAEKSKPKAVTPTFEEDFHQCFPRSYTKKISDLCAEQHVKLHFLYIPSYGSADKPNDYDEYIKYGDVMLPPKTIFNNVSNWHDDGHLNLGGSEELSLWISDYMKNNWR